MIDQLYNHEDDESSFSLSDILSSSYLGASVSLAKKEPSFLNLFYY